MNVTRRIQEGFALPTILIASVVMLIVLTSAVTATESVRTGLDRQYYDQLAREAAESGLAYAQYCLQNNGYLPSWSNSYPLRPDRDCSGVNSNGASQYIINQDNIRLTFSVPYPQNMTVSQLAISTGTVELLRPSSGQVWRTYTYSTSARIGVSLSLNTVAFSYAGGYGAAFGTVIADGTLRMLGFNGWGQLSNGSFSDTLTPTSFKLNGTDKPVSVFTNFVSQGYNTFVLTDKGDIYGAGFNGSGQLGDGTTTSRNQAVKFNLPAGKSGQYVTLGGFQTYVLTTDGNIYSAGDCGAGRLGYNYTISGCTNQSLYKRVNLPTVTTNQNTIPTTNIVTDYQSAFVRMQGGQVWGWGGNSSGLLANGTTTDTSNPIQIGTFGNSGQPKATQIATDGITLYVLDSNGKVWASGSNSYGATAGGAPIRLDNISKCLDNKTQDGVTIQLYTCNNTVAQDWIWQTDGTIYNANKNVCLNSLSNNHDMNLATCDGTSRQRWTFNDNGTISNAANGLCLNNGGNDGVTLIVYSCSGAPANELFSLPSVSRFVQVQIPAVAGNAVKIATDAWFTSILTSNGQVWSMGINNHGQLGNGTAKLYQPYPVKFILPSGVTALDVYSTSYSPDSDTRYTNTFVVGSNGKVYGAGSNAFGQLGDGTTTQRNTPVAMGVIDGSTIKALQVESGYGTTIVLTDNHKIYTVGNNGNGQLGDGTTNNSSTPQANQYTNALPITMF
ncbi:MAG TPA: ricin-type beta-trefoil lectin domain protein [Verrucomicrobiae bacterium]|nr:ricin-type beta-trefoil lectin domain protein [Verrucomicrobiae bacterium]